MLSPTATCITNTNILEIFSEHQINIFDNFVWKNSQKSKWHSQQIYFRPKTKFYDINRILLLQKMQGKLQIALKPLAINNKKRMLKLMTFPSSLLGPLPAMKLRHVTVLVMMISLRPMPDLTTLKKVIKGNCYLNSNSSTNSKVTKLNRIINQDCKIL